MTTAQLLVIVMLIAYSPFFYGIYKEIQEEIKRRKDHKR